MEIDRLRRLPGNKVCADCGSGPTVWASVNLGIFLCMACGSHHRGIGTHISKPKGCTGTYLWGPDEIQAMQNMGNDRANQLYGSDRHQRPSAVSSTEEWRTFLTNKYQSVAKCQSAVGSDSMRVAPHQEPADLIAFDDTPLALQADSKDTSPDSLKLDFFAEFGV